MNQVDDNNDKIRKFRYLKITEEHVSKKRNNRNKLSNKYL
jgi:hypothetical protein